MNVCLIVGIWILMAVLVNPLGDFPLNDDWAYGWSVKVLVETGDFRLSDWTAVNLLPQVLWGAVFSVPVGFSFTALRFSTLTLGLVGVLATYGLLREIKASPGVSLVGALVVALNPIYFALSNSFMSDVPSFALVTGAAYFMLRGLRRRTARDLVAGISLAIVSILNRQTGLILLPAFAAAWVAPCTSRTRSGWRRRGGCRTCTTSRPRCCCDRFPAKPSRWRGRADGTVSSSPRTSGCSCCPFWQ